MIAQFNAQAEKQAAAAVPPSDASLAGNVTEAVTNATANTFRRFFAVAAQSSSFVTCARIYSLNWCVNVRACLLEGLVGHSGRTLNV